MDLHMTDETKQKKGERHRKLKNLLTIFYSSLLTKSRKSQYNSIILNIIEHCTRGKRKWNILYLQKRSLLIITHQCNLRAPKLVVLAMSYLVAPPTMSTERIHAMLEKLIMNFRIICHCATRKIKIKCLSLDQLLVHPQYASFQFAC